MTRAFETGLAHRARDRSRQIDGARRTCQLEPGAGRWRARGFASLLVAALAACSSPPTPTGYTQPDPVDVGSRVVIQGAPSIQAGSYRASTDHWYQSPRDGRYARLTGLLANTGSVSARDVTVSVTFKDMTHSFLGRASHIRIGTIEAGSSRAFEVIESDVFPDGGLSSRILEIEISSLGDASSSVWSCTSGSCQR